MSATMEWKSFRIHQDLYQGETQTTEKTPLHGSAHIISFVRILCWLIKLVPLDPRSTSQVADANNHHLFHYLTQNTFMHPLIEFSDNIIDFVKASVFTCQYSHFESLSRTSLHIRRITKPLNESFNCGTDERQFKNNISQPGLHCLRRISMNTKRTNFTQ